MYGANAILDLPTVVSVVPSAKADGAAKRRNTDSSRADMYFFIAGLLRDYDFGCEGYLCRVVAAESLAPIRAEHGNSELIKIYIPAS